MRFGDLDVSVQWCEENLGTGGSKFLEEDIEWAAADNGLLSNPVFGNSFIVSVGEAFRQGVQGFAQDITVQSHPWPFDLGAIAATVRVLHGEEDSLLPEAHSEHTAALIPGASLEVLPGHGHLSITTETPRLAADLVVSLR
jgi:pimeloyl-ACP methyl ester carboxylesterase